MKYKKTNPKYKKAYGGLTEEDIESYGELSQGTDQVSGAISNIPVAGQFIQLSDMGADTFTGGDYTVDEGDDLGERMGKGVAGNLSHKTLTSNIDEHGFWEGLGRQLVTSSSWGLLNENKIFKNGGYIYANGGDLVKFNEGGTHESNGLGGIPLGPTASVEEGETMNNDYVYSDRLKINKQLAEEYSLPKKAIGKTFADVSKMYEDESRPNDIYSKRMKDKELDNLKSAQESFKQVEGIDQPQQQMAMGGPKPSYSNRVELVRNEGSMLPYLAQEMKGLAGVSDSSDTVYRAFDNLPDDKKNEFAERAVGNFYRKQDPMKQNYQNYQSTRKDFADGGWVGGLFNYLNSNPEIPVDESTLGNDNFNLKTTSITRQPSNQEYIDYGDSMKKSGTDASSPEGYGSYLRYAPALAELGNMISLMANKPKPKDLDMFNTNREFDENLVNRNQIKRDIESQGKAINRQLSNVSGGNAGSLMSNLIGTNVDTQRALANANMSSDELDSREKARVQALNYQQDARNQSSRMRVADMNDQDQGVYSGLLMDSTSNLGQNLGGIGQDEMNRNMAYNLPVGYYMDRNNNVKRKPNYGG